jgi:sugar diacid utilization regulator
VWIRIQEEHFAQLALFEEVDEIFHRVGPKTSDVLIVSWVQVAQHFDAIHDKVRDFHANLHSERELVLINFTQTHKKSSVTATNVSELDFPVASLWIKLVPRLMIRAFVFIQIGRMNRTEKLPKLTFNFEFPQFLDLLLKTVI